MFNSLVTNFAPACYVLWEQDINPRDSLGIQKAMPSIYKIFKQKDLFSYANFILWLLKGLVQSLIIFYISSYCANSSAIRPDGFVTDLWGMSIMAYSSTFAVIMLELFIKTYNFTIIVHIFYWILAVVLFFPSFVFLWDQFTSPLQYYAADMYAYGKFWLVLLLNLTICGSYKYGLFVLKKFFKPDEVDKLQYERYCQKIEKKQKQVEINKRIEIMNKSNKVGQNDAREYEMDNLAKESEGGDNVASEWQFSDKRNLPDYHFMDKMKVVEALIKE